jgi:hypothetical protein
MRGCKKKNETVQGQEHVESITMMNQYTSKSGATAIIHEPMLRLPLVRLSFLPRRPREKLVRRAWLD